MPVRGVSDLLNQDKKVTYSGENNVFDRRHVVVLLFG